MRQNYDDYAEYEYIVNDDEALILPSHVLPYIHKHSPYKTVVLGVLLYLFILILYLQIGEYFNGDHSHGSSEENW